MAYCIIRTCTNNSRNNSNLKFHKLPTNSLRAAEWVHAADNPNVNKHKAKSNRVCSKHFEPKYVVRHPHKVLYGLAPPISYRGLTENAVPTLYLPERSKTLETAVECDLPNNAIDLPERSVQENKEYFKQETLPKQEETRMAWIITCGLEGMVEEHPNLVICSKHFTDQDYVDSKAVEKGARVLTLKHGAVPSVSVPYSLFRKGPEFKEVFNIDDKSEHNSFNASTSHQDVAIEHFKKTETSIGEKLAEGYNQPVNMQLVIIEPEVGPSTKRSPNSFVCEDHFLESDYKPKPEYLQNCPNYCYSPRRRRIKDEAIPSQNLSADEQTNRCSQWKEIIGNPIINHLPAEECHTRLRVCGIHFEDLCFSSMQKNRLKKCAVPTIFEFDDESDIGNKVECISSEDVSQNISENEPSVAVFEPNMDNTSPLPPDSCEITDGFSESFVADPSCVISLEPRSADRPHTPLMFGLDLYTTPEDVLTAFRNHRHRCRTCFDLIASNVLCYNVNDTKIGSKTLKTILSYLVKDMVILEPSDQMEDVCSYCYEKLKNMWSFVEVIRKTEEKLKYIAEASKTKDDQMTIKEIIIEDKSNQDFQCLGGCNTTITGLDNLFNHMALKHGWAKNTKLAFTPVKTENQSAAVVTTSVSNGRTNISQHTSNIIPKEEKKVQQPVMKQNGEVVLVTGSKLLNEQSILSARLRAPIVSPVTKNKTPINTTSRVSGNLPFERVDIKSTIILEDQPILSVGSTQIDSQDVVSLCDSDDGVSIISSRLSNSFSDGFSDDSNFDGNKYLSEGLEENSKKATVLNSVEKLDVYRYNSMFSIKVPNKTIDEVSDDLLKKNIRVLHIQQEHKEVTEENEVKPKRLLLVGVSLFNCKECKMEFTDKDSFEAHNSLVHKKKKLVLRKIFDDIIFEETTLPSKGINCDICDKLCYNTYYLTLHLRAEHPGLGKFKCHRCGKMFSTKYMRDCHWKKFRNYDSCAYKQCGVCKEYVKVAEMREHTKEHNKKVHICDRCGKTFVCAMSLKKHCLRHDNIISQERLCEICGKTFSHSSNYINHFRLHFAEDSSQTIYCDKCPKTFKSDVRLKRHVRRVHSGKRKDPVQCPDCGKVCMGKVALDSHHKLKHSKEFRYNCNVCGVGFSRGDYYKRHMNRHANGQSVNGRVYTGKYVSKTGKVRYRFQKVTTPLRCNICMKTYRNMQSLRIHVDTHIKMKRRFQCSICPLSFTMKANKIRHEKTHENPLSKYKCNICWKLTQSQEELEEHLAIHNNKRKYECELCGERFARSYLLDNHIVSEHKDDVDAEKEKEMVYKEALEPYLLDADTAPLVEWDITPDIDLELESDV